MPLAAPVDAVFVKMRRSIYLNASFSSLSDVTVNVLKDECHLRIFVDLPILKYLFLLFVPVQVRVLCPIHESAGWFSGGNLFVNIKVIYEKSFLYYLCVFSVLSSCCQCTELAKDGCVDGT